MAVNNYDAIISALTSGKGRKFSFFKTSQTTDAAGAPCLSWRATGIPGAGSVPATGAGTIPTKDTAGAIFFANASGADNSYLTKFGMGGATLGTAWLIDICWFNSGLSGTVATAQSFTSTPLTRYTTGDDLEIGLVCWTTTGTTAVNVTTSYTNQAGTTARTTPSVAFWTGGYGGGTVAPTADQMQILPLQAGDYGVRAMASVTLSATTGTAGNFGAMIFKRLATIAWSANVYLERDLVLQTTSLPEKQDDACLAILYIPSTTSTGNNHGLIELVEG